MADLPTPLITEILSRLPVRSLLRFRCVSKSWQSIIDDQRFIKSHLENSTNQIIIFKGSYVSVDFPALSQPTKMNHPLKGGNHSARILGSCNGLLYLQNEDRELGTIIYNPATKQHREVPISPIEFPFPELHLLTWCEGLEYGFGYDQVNDDYKILRIVQFSSYFDDRYEYEVKVFSLKINSWTRVGDLFHDCFISSKGVSGIYINGCLIWTMTRKCKEVKSDVLVGFDLGLEEWKVVEQPKYNSVGVCWVACGVLGGCLSVVCSYSMRNSEVWVMKEFGVGESWSKLFAVSFDCVWPIAYSKDGSKVLIEQDFKELFWFDLRRQRTEFVQICGMPSKLCGEILVESLVPVGSRKGKMPKKKRNEKSRQASSLLALLPTNLLFDILSRIPASILLQLRCVCKWWNDAINDPDFAKMHCEVLAKANYNLNLIINEKKLQLVDFNLLNRAVQINHPLVSSNGVPTIIGSCRGLVCLYDKNDEFAIWNPLTGSCHKIPIIRLLSDAVPNLFVHGFGYDSINDDYKIIRIVQYCFFASSDDQVYSLKAKCWRRMKFSSDKRLSFTYSGVFASGALHWLVSGRRDVKSTCPIIVALDLGLEKFRDVQQPTYDDTDFRGSLGLLGESLCMLCRYCECSVEMWVMKDYEMQSWCKLVSITIPKPDEFFQVKPLAYSKDGGEVLLEVDNSKLIWYDLKNETIRNVNLSGLPTSFKTTVFAGSLLDPGEVIEKFEMDNKKVNGSPSVSHKKRRDELDGFLSKGFKLKL